MGQAARGELRDFAEATSSHELAELAKILERNLKELERMNIDHKAQTQDGLKRLDKILRDLAKEVNAGFGKIFNQDDGLAGKVTAIDAELKHKPDYRGLYRALITQLALFVAVTVGLARFFGLI